MKETTNYVVKKRLSFLLLSNFSNFKKSFKSVLVVPLLLFIFLFAQQSFAAVNVTFTGTAANATFTAGSPYANMAAAVTAMNASMASTTGSGTVVFTATANETVPNGTGLYITATGSATIGLVIDGAGFTFTSGTNTAGGNLDAVFKIVGGDYITIQNCVIQENAANIVTATGATNTMTEAGILLIHASATNGASNNTIQNNTITLSASYANAVGILSTSGSTTTNASPGANTTAAATSTAGTNSSNKFYGNVISNVQYGFLILCSPVTATVNESGNDIGGTSTTTGNRITFGVNSAASGPWNLSPAGSKAGILCRNAGAISIRYNTITSISTLAESVAGAGVNGIAMSFGTGPTIAHTTTISNNTINIYQTGSTAVQGIDFGHSSGGGSANATYVASDNNITINHSTTTASTAGVVTGIKMSYTTATKTINKDTITIKQSVSGAGTFTGIVNYVNISAVATTANVTNCLFNTTGSNILSTGNLTGIFQDATVTTLVNMKGNTVNVSRTAASGSVFFTSTSGTPSEVADTISNNNITFTGLAGTTAVTVISSLGGPTSPVVGNKSICGNTINVTGSNSGTIIGITAAFTNTGNINANNITMSTASPNTTGITTSGTAMTMVNNTLSLTTSTTSLTSITGIAASSGTGTFNINNNTISALNASGIITTATNIYGISYSGTGTNTVNINNNRISGVSIGASTSSASPNIAAINVTGGVTTMSKNKICDISTLCTGATTIVSGIRLSSTTASANMVVSNNYIGNLTATVSTNTDAIRGINILSTSATATISVFYNTIYINSASTAATSGSSGIFHTISATATTAALDLRNNIIVNTSTPQGAGLTVAYRRSAGAANNLANYSSNSNNNLFYAGTPGASRLIYSDGTSTGQTLALYKAGVFTAGTIAPRDAASVTEDPTSFFVSTTCGNAGFLHITAGSTTQIESGAVSPNTTTYATDYDGDIRQGSAGYPAQTNGGGTAPDIGADEGDFRPAKPSITLNSITPSTTQCTATARAISVNVTTPSPTTISSVTISYNNGAAAGPLAMTNSSGTTWTYSIPAASPTNTTVTWSVTATNNLGFSTTYTGGTYQDDPNVGITATATARPTTVCSGAADTLSVIINKSGTGVIGSGSVNSSSSPTPFSGTYGGMKGQYIILASELTAAGYTAGNITAIGINFVSSVTATYTGLTIQIGNTALSAFPGTLSLESSGLATYYGPTNLVNPTAGVNTFTLSSSFYWDGTSNIIISTNWSNNTTTSTAASVVTTTTAFNSAQVHKRDSYTPAALLALTGTQVGGSSVVGTARPNFTITGNTAPAPTTYVWSDGASTVSTTNPGYVNPTANPTNYTCTATVSGCPLVSNTVAVTVVSLPSAPSLVGNSTQCGTGVPTASVSGAGTLKWYDATTGGTLLQTGGTTYASSISATDTFYVSSFNGTCESVRTMVIATVNSPDALTASASSTTIACLGNSTNLSVSQTGSSQSYTLTWTATPSVGSGIPTSAAGALGTPLTITPTLAGSYRYTITGVDGSCTTFDTIRVTVNDPNAGTTATATARPTTVCSGAADTLSVQVAKSGTVTVGTGTTLTTATSQPTSFCNRWGSYRMQTIFTGAELTALGLKAGNITSMTFNITTNGDATTNANFTVKIGNTASSTFATTSFASTVSGFTTVYPAATYTHAIGVNTINFSTPFNWDGSSNIIVEVMHDGANATNNAITYYTATAGNSVLNTTSSSTGLAQTTGTGTQSTQRLNVTFTGNTAPAPTAYVWSDGATTVSTTNPGYVNPTVNPTNYTCTATVGGCPLVSNTVAVTVVSLPTAPTLVGNSVQCGAGVPTASISGAATLRWYDLPTGGTVLQSGGTTYASSISATDTFYVSSFNGTCESSRTMVIATVNAPDALTASASSTTIACLGNSTNLSVAQTGSTQSYTLTWTATPSAGSGIPTSAAGALGTPLTVTPTLAGSYRYTITGVDGACTTFDTIRVTVNNPNVGITAVATAQPTTVCSGEADTLSVVVTKNATVTLGAGGSTSTLAPYNPFNGGYGGMKGQYLIRASELTALGLTAGNITGLTLYVSSVGTTYNGFVVQIGNTALTSLTSSTIQGSLTTVKNSFNITPTAGANSITFDTPFSWNGTSNIIVSTSWSNNNASNASATIFYDATAFQSSVSYRKDNETAANMLAFTGATGAGTFTYDNASSRPRLSFTGNTAPAPTAYVWSDGASTVSTTNPGYVNPTVNPTNYTCTATVSGCPVVSNTVAVTVVSLPTAPTLVGNSVQCGAGVPTASVSGAATLRWYDLPTGGTVLQSGGTTYASSISATDTFYVSSFNGTCESARTMVIATVNAPDALTASASSTTIACLGNSTDLSVAQTGNSQSYTLTWTATPSAGSGIPTSAAGALGTPLTITPTAAGSYRYTITGVDGACTTFDTIRVTVNDPNAGATIVATARPTTVCTGDADTLTLVVAKSGTVSTGAGASTSSSAGTSPFYHGYGGQKAQYIYRASELIAMGLTAGNLTALSLNITSLGTTNMSNFSISIGHTAQNAAVTNSAITTGLTTVYNSASQTLTSGTNTYTFGAAFNWNGTSNLVISFNYSNVNSGGTSSTVTTDAAGFTSTLGIYADNSTAACLFAAPASAQACMGLSSNTTTSNRPTLTITGNKVQTPASFTWSDGASTVSTTNPGYVNPTVNPTNYTCTATVSGCPVVSNTVAVTVVPLPTTPTLVGNSTQCGPGVPTASVSGAATLKWYLVPTGGTAVQTGGTTYATSISATDTFYVSSNNGTCESARIMVIATVTVPDSIIAYAGGTGTSGGTSSPPNITACPNTALNLYVLKNSGTNSYNYTWSCATAGNGISTSTGNNISVTPTAAGLFNYIVTANDPISGCNNVDTVRVRVIPTSITATALATNLCGAGSSTTISIPSAGLGTSTVQWQKDSSGTWVNVGTDSTTLVTPNLDTTTSFRALVKVGGSTCLTSNTVTINVNNVAITSTTPASRCTPGTLTLSATGTSGSTIKWYTDPTGGTLLQTGTSFTTPSLSSTTDYYVEAVNGTTSVTSNVGPNSPNDGIGSFGTSFTGTYQVFDVAATMVLNSVDVFATTTGTVIVELLNSSGTVINTAATYNVTAGQANSTSTSVGTAITIPINFTIPAGTGYELTLKSTSTATILRNDGGMASYYNIVGSEPTFTDNWLFDIDYWYDFYKWNVTVTGACASVRTLVTATVAAPTTNPTVTATQTICQDSIVLLTASGSTSSPTTLLFEGFESNPPAGFNLNTNGTFSDFYIEPYYIEGSQSIGLVSDSWDGTNIRITQSSPINLSAYTNAELTFYHICASEPGFDYGYVQYSTDNGGSWTSFPTSAYTGGATLQNSVVSFDASSYSDWNTQFYDEYQDPGTAPATSLWKRESINLTPYIGTTQFKVRFRMTYDFFTDYYGWLIDSVHIAGTKTVKYAWTPKTRLYTNPAATVAYDSITTPDTDTVYAKPNDTITYTALAYTQIPSACFGSNTVTVNVSKKPTAIIDSVKLFICDGSAILKASSVTPPSSSLNWTNISGSGSSSASGNPVTITGLTAGTSIYQLKATNGQCIDIPIGKDTIVTPTTVPSTVSTTNSCNLCIYTDGTTKTFYNSTDGKIIGTIQDDAAVTPAELGETEMCLDIAGSVPSVVDNFGLNQPYLQRRWTIKPTTNTNSIITLYFTTAELTALQAAANTTRYQFSGYDLYVTKFDGGGNGTFTPPCTGGTGGCGMVTGRSVPAVFGAYNGDHFVSFTINSFSTFYVHPALFPFAPLPVELISFNGWNAGAVNQLQWKTASEKNTAKFIVEKSIDGVTYTSIGEQTAAGNSTTTLSYSLSDNQPVIGNNYYRLKTVDIDGKFSYSDVINIPVNEAYTNSFTRVYPNPTKGNLNVEIQSSTTSNTKIVVFDVVGKKIFEKETSLVKGINTLTFDVADYADGAYILQFIDSTGKTQTTKFVKK